MHTYGFLQESTNTAVCLPCLCQRCTRQSTHRTQFHACPNLFLLSDMNRTLGMCLDSVYRVTSCVWSLYIRGTHCYSSFQLNEKIELKRVSFLQRIVLRVLHVLPRTWLFMFLNPANPSKQMIKTVKPKLRQKPPLWD